MASPPIILNNNKQMKKITKENRFNEAIKALVKGYFDGTLIKTDCRACAVGNIVANALGVNIVDGDFIGASGETLKSWEKKAVDITPKFSWPAITPECSWPAAVWPVRGLVLRDPEKEGIEQVELTGYDEFQMADVERAFMLQEDMYEGLMAVVDVLCEIEGKSQEEVKEYKEMFVKE